MTSSNPIRPEDFAKTFELTCPVVVLGVVTVGARSEPLSAPRAWKRSPDFGVFGHDEFAIVVNGYTVGLVYFRSGEGSPERAVQRWSAWQQPMVIEQDVRD